MFRPFDSHGINILRHVVYRSVERDTAAVRVALNGLGPVVVAVHSPRAAIQFASLVPATRRMRIHVAAISARAAQVCGKGWASVAVAAKPDDPALLACAEALCIRAG